MKMKTILPLSVITAMLCMYGCSCGSSDTTYLGDYVNTYNAGGPTRSEAVTFTINNVAYLTTGINGQTITNASSSANGNDLNSTWSYDAAVGWNQLADFPAPLTPTGAPNARYSAVAFAIGSSAYVGTGFDGTTMYKDFYKFTPSTNTWVKVADFPGTARYDAVAFAIGNYGYVGTGYDNSVTNDFYRYDPVANAWIGSNSTGARMPNLTGFKRSAAAAWVSNGRGYVCTGSNSGTFLDDFWQFNPTVQSSGAVGVWTSLRRISNATDSSYDDLYATPNITRKNAIAMVTGGDTTYLMSGDNGSPLPSNWMWLGPGNDQWVVQQPMGSPEAPTVTGAVMMQIGRRGFIATGQSGSTYYNQFWEFLPNIQVNNNN